MSPPPNPRTLALFQKRIEGDDSLLRLSALRFRQAGLGTELYAGTPDELDSLWPFRPAPEEPAIVHLDRGVNLLDERSRSLIAEFAHRFKGRVYGLVFHDQPQMASETSAYFHAAQTLARQVEGIPGAPRLFIEYAAGLDPDCFQEFFELARGIECLSACIDVGHVGTRQVRQSYSRMHPGEEVCGLAPDGPRVPALAGDIQDAVRSALPAALSLIQALGKLGKPLHFHLHDGHPLSTFSPYGVSDHLSFLARIPVPFEYGHKCSLDPMYGPFGLLRIVSKAVEVIHPAELSFTLEIHPVEGRLPLRDASYLFGNWRDLANAERMNYWLSVLLDNHQLLLSAQQAAGYPESLSGAGHKL